MPRRPARPHILHCHPHIGGRTNIYQVGHRRRINRDKCSQAGEHVPTCLQAAVIHRRCRRALRQSPGQIPAIALGGTLNGAALDLDTDPLCACSVVEQQPYPTSFMIDSRSDQCLSNHLGAATLTGGVASSPVLVLVMQH